PPHHAALACHPPREENPSCEQSENIVIATGRNQLARRARRDRDESDNDRENSAQTEKHQPRSARPLSDQRRDFMKYLPHRRTAAGYSADRSGQLLHEILQIRPPQPLLLLAISRHLRL